MADRPAMSNLQGMYTTTAPRVRDQPAAYGPHEVDSDPFPAARVLRDLSGADDANVPLILARYAVLRSWRLRGAKPALSHHAERAARAYVAHLGDGPEAGLLARLIGGSPELTAVGPAAAEALRSGHREGAFALLRAGYLEARRRGDLSGAAGLADAIARLLEDAGLDGAGLWARRARRLQRGSDR